MRTMLLALVCAAALGAFAPEAAAASDADETVAADSECRVRYNDRRPATLCGGSAEERRCQINVRAVSRRFAMGQRRHFHTIRCRD